MKTLIALSSDPIFKPKLLLAILRKKRASICAVVVVGEKKYSKKWRHIIKNAQFWGIKASLYISSAKICHKMIKHLPFPISVKARSDIRQICKLYQIPCYFTQDINDASCIKTIKKIEPDVILSFQHQIFKKDLLRIAKKTTLNCHPALLPKYRGVKPIFWAMLNKDKKIGVTVHTMEQTVDTGWIVSQDVFDNSPKSTLWKNYHKAYQLSASVILDALEKTERNLYHNLLKIDQSSAYYKFPTSQHKKKFIQHGSKMI